MKSYGQFIDKSIALDESIVGRYFDSSRFGPGGNKNVTTGLKPNVPTVRQQQKTKPNNPTKPPLRATSQRPQRPINNDNKKGREAVRNIAQKVVAKASDPQVRSRLSGLNQVRKNLPTAADFAPTSQSGLGMGGSFKGRSFSSLKNFGNRKKFEPSEIVKRKGLGDNKVSQVVRRGRELDADGNPINKPKDTSFKGKAKNFLKRKLGITDKVDTPKPKDEPIGANRVTSKGPKPDDSGSKVTTGKGKPNPSSGGAEAKTPKANKQAAKPKANDSNKSVGVNVSGKQPLRRFTKKPEEPDKRVRVDEPKTDPSKLNKVKGFKDEPKQGNIPGIKTEKKPETKKKPRKQRTPEQQTEINKKTAATKARNRDEAAKKSGQGTINFNKDQRDQSRQDAVEKTKVKITGDTKLKGSDKVTSSDNVDKTSKPVEKPVEKSVEKPVEKKKPPGKKRGPKPGSTNVRTLAKQNRQKKEAKKTLSKAVERQAEADAAKDAVKDMRQTPKMGKVTDDVRSQLTKTLAKTESDPNKSTQLKGKSDEELTRTTTSSDDEGSFRRGAKRTKKYSNNPKTQAAWEKIENRTPEEEEAAQQKMFGNKGAERATRKEIDKLRKKDTFGKKKTINPNAPKSGEKKNVKKSYKTTSRKKETTKNESFSHWREEFIWETDKKYPEKVKEIKPMTGKNTITINPEDETSKYKRGY